MKKSSKDKKTNGIMKVYSKKRRESQDFFAELSPKGKDEDWHFNFNDEDVKEDDFTMPPEKGPDVYDDTILYAMAASRRFFTWYNKFILKII